ncbi:MAG: tRNA pseudouridine(38-40) synthase TruA [Clostridia bacterium]|nr:tRNA pseudouridine(38-40) synthase TruA [Clostridia bacterium]
MKYLLTIAYDGRRYCGYQVQKNGVTVQEELCRAANTVFGKQCPITGCSRTDSGVHARDFKATLEVEGDTPSIPPEKVSIAMNCHLPEDISVLSSRLVAESFHPRYDVIEKEYRYLIHNAPSRDPFLAGRAWHYPRSLNDTLMNEAASVFLGEHDFSAFMASGSDVIDTVRKIYVCRVDREGDKVVVTVSGNGFLYNMVRIIVGTLVAVSEGKLSSDELKDVIASRDRGRAGITAPACGLYLNRVEYRHEEGEV